MKSLKTQSLYPYFCPICGHARLWDSHPHHAILYRANGRWRNRDGDAGCLIRSDAYGLRTYLGQSFRPVRKEADPSHWYFGLCDHLGLVWISHRTMDALRRKNPVGILSSATAPTTMAYISDSTPEKERGSGMGLLGAAGGVGTIIGPALGGFLGGESLSTPFFAAAGLSILSLFLAWVFLPEPIRPGIRQEKETRESLSNLSEWLKMIRGPIGVLFILTFFSTCGLMIFASIFGLYALQRFGFDPKDVGVMMMVLGLVSAISQGFLVGMFSKKWGDENTVKAGMLATSLSYLLLLMANDYLTILIATAIFGTCTALLIPVLTSMVSKYSKSPQGISWD